MALAEEGVDGVVDLLAECWCCCSRGRAAYKRRGWLSYWLGAGAAVMRQWLKKMLKVSP